MTGSSRRSAPAGRRLPCRSLAASTRPRSSVTMRRSLPSPAAIFSVSRRTVARSSARRPPPDPDSRRYVSIAARSVGFSVITDEVHTSCSRLRFCRFRISDWDRCSWVTKNRCVVVRISMLSTRNAPPTTSAMSSVSNTISRKLSPERATGPNAWRASSRSRPGIVISPALRPAPAAARPGPGWSFHRPGRARDGRSA